MVDPKPTIRIEGVCRGDGRCPVCGASASTRFPLSMPCGCAGCAWPGCAAAHLHALLTEALRQRQMDREFLGFPGEDGVKPARAEYAPEMDTMETLAYVETCAAAWEPWVRLLGNAQAGDIVAACLAVKALLEERDAAIRDTAKASAAVEALRSALYEQRERADAAIREAASRYDCHGGPGTATAPCGACVSCVMRRAEKAERERDAAIAKEESKARDLAASDLLLNQYAEERDAAIRERDEARLRLGDAARELPEIAGPIHHRIQKFRESYSMRITHAEQRADRAKALLRECIEMFHRCNTSYVYQRDTLLAKIREALPK